MAAVRARVTDQLVAFVERLRQFQSALGAEAVQPVGVPLKFCEVVQQWRRHAAYLGIDLLDLCRAAADALDDCLGFVAVRGEFHGRVERLDTGAEPSAFVGLSLARRECRNHVPVIFGDEIANRKFALHQHGKRWGLNAANGEFLVAGQRVGAREVHAHQPVGPAAATRRVGQMVILAPVPQFRETLLDRLRCQGGNPEAAHRPSTSSGFIDVTEDQFSFSARVRCTDNTADARGCEDFADNLELILGLLANHQRPRFRKHGQQVAPPGAPFWPDLVRLCEPHQVADRPGDDIAVAVQIAFAAFGGAQDSSNVARHRRLFGDNRDAGLRRHLRFRG